MFLEGTMNSIIIIIIIIIYIYQANDENFANLQFAISCLWCSFPDLDS